MIAEPRKVLPILKTDEPVCPEGKLSCGNGECIEKELFCNDKPDCKDESDENACSEYDTHLRMRFLLLKKVLGEKYAVSRPRYVKTTRLPNERMKF